MEIGIKNGFLLAVAPEFFNQFFPLSKVLLIKPYFYVQALSEDVALVLKNLMFLIEREYSGRKRQNLLEAYLATFLIPFEARGVCIPDVSFLFLVLISLKIG
ncbi:hypothetical protein [Adhaeribacter aquaticus]|uniref:hypothetical protein n=1 Tax=Adhaeribacter aquaticus TaxID=299567 RepID=UPI000417A5A9|nr:hypothetical protein [Adhaeribacter aquaticus]